MKTFRAAILSLLLAAPVFGQAVSNQFLSGANGRNTLGATAGVWGDALIAAAISRDSEVNGYFADPSTNGSFNAANWLADIGALAPNGAMSGGTINNSVIGGVTPAAITGTSLATTTGGIDIGPRLQYLRLGTDMADPATITRTNTALSLVMPAAGEVIELQSDNIYFFDRARDKIFASFSNAGQSFFGGNNYDPAAMFIENGGNVGIGTVDPTVKLDVRGAILTDASVTVPTEVYGAGWSGDLSVATKDALFDIIETLGGSGAPSDPTFITQTAHAGLSAEQPLSALPTGVVKVTTGTGVLSTAVANTDYLAPTGAMVGGTVNNSIIGSITPAPITGTTVTATTSVTTVTEAYDDAGWDADNTTPTKDAIRDLIEVELNFVDLADPNADRGLFWDDSAGLYQHFDFGTGLSMATTTLTLDADLTDLADGSLTGSLVSAASDTAVGVSELATAAETTTGTDAARTVTPDGLAGSDFGIRSIQLTLVAPATDAATGDGIAYFYVPASLNGFNIFRVHAQAVTAGTTGTSDFQIARVRSGTPADCLSTKLTLDSTESGSETAAAAAVIDAANDDLVTHDLLRVDVDALSTTKPRGVMITIEAQKP